MRPTDLWAGWPRFK